MLSGRGLLPALAALIVAVSPSPVHAQERVITRFELERYFADSLSANSLRVVADNRTDTISSTVSTWRLRPGHFVTIGVGTTATAATPFPAPVRGDLMALPFRYLTTDSSGAATLYLRPAVEIERGGLRYEGKDRGFRGSFLLGLQDSLQYQASYTLSPGIQFALTADADSLEPTSLSVEHTNLPFERVRLVTFSPSDSVRLHIRPQFNPEGADLWLPVQRPALTVTASPERIQGFGLETAALSLGRTANAPAEPVVVRVTSDRGNPTPNELTLSEAGTGLAKIRSSGLGTATIRAESPPFGSGEALLYYVFPLAFLIAALLGGGLAAIARALYDRRRNKQVSIVGYAISGLLVGLVIAVLYAVGANVLELDVKAEYGEALVFAIAAVGAIGGIPALVRALPGSS